MTPPHPPTIPAPPSAISLTPTLLTWRAGVPLHRVWPARFAANAFNPGAGARTRFAPIATPVGVTIPTLYAGETQICAFYERIFHDVPLEPAGLRTVHVNALRGLVAGTVLPKRDLSLAQLFRPDLERWGLTRALVHSDADHYEFTAAWAAALHRDFGHLDGLVWTSNRADPAMAVLLFGDRCATAIDAGNDAEDLLTSAALLKVLNDCAERAGIRIVRL